MFDSVNKSTSFSGGRVRAPLKNCAGRNAARADSFRLPTASYVASLPQVWKRSHVCCYLFHFLPVQDSVIL